MKNSICPHCQFQRQPEDNGPTWQCSNCGKAYRKQHGEPPPPSRQVQRAVIDNESFISWQKRLNTWLIIALCSSAAAFYYKNQLPDTTEINSALSQEPIQRQTKKPPSSFQYFDRLYNIRPVADYELWGLVVSHNNTSGMGDIYHDETSLDTKDLCVLWGENLANNQFRSATFSSTAWTCHLEYPAGISLNLQQVSNNHLITDSDDIRQKIEGIRIGDQIRLKGWLVDYQENQNSHFWRKTSINREDLGNGACEVVFVQEIEVIERNNPSWYALWFYGLIACVTIILAKIIIVLVEISPHRH
ncbi:MAG: hypothetical protein KUG82_20165 [Pseudomonadales bacterium]|nr:hypothetical protein [Pseudomonadales bacterium]